MNEYHKILTVYKRDPGTKYKTLLEGQFSTPEFEYLRDAQWTFTEKVDGTNIRVIFNVNCFQFKGRTDAAEIPNVLLVKLQDVFGARVDVFKEVFEGIAYDGSVCLYGEGYGGKIQKAGQTYGPDQRFVLFDVKINQGWLQRKDVEDVARKLGVEVVPIVAEGTLLEMVEHAKGGIRSQWGDFPAEGYVARPKVELVARNGHRIITKIRHRDFPSAGSTKRRFAMFPGSSVGRASGC